MKRIICVLCLLCCGVAFAGQVTINWGTDNQTYTTTTCEVGGDVILPAPPTKRGYTFRGWKKDSFNRGTVANCKEIPINVNEYVQDKYGNRTPKENDTIIVNDASDYIDSDFLRDEDNIVVTKATGAYNIYVSIGQTITSYYYTTIQSWFQLTDNISIIYRPGAPGRWYLKSDIPYYVNNILTTGEKEILNTKSEVGTSVYVSAKMTDFEPVVLNGSWKFVYNGIWDMDGIFGWTPVEQIGE